VVVHPANGCGSTLFWDAGIATLLTNTCKVQWAFWVCDTFRFRWFSNRSANLVSIAFIARWADASRPVVVNFTYCIDSALVVIYTGIFAFLTDTCKCSGTISVYCAFWLALYIGITLEPRRTGALANPA
jgi:hypothetical protein